MEDWRHDPKWLEASAGMQQDSTILCSLVREPALALSYPAIARSHVRGC